MISLLQAEGDAGPGGVEPEGAGLPGVRDGDRGAAAGRPQHGPRGVRERGRPEEVHLRQGEHQLPLLQRVLRLRLPHGPFHALRQDNHAHGKTDRQTDRRTEQAGRKA